MRREASLVVALFVLLVGVHVVHAVPSPTPVEGRVKLLSVDPVLQVFTLKNMGGSNVTITAMVLCADFSCSQLSALFGFSALQSSNSRLMPNAEVTLTFGSFPTTTVGADVVLFVDGSALNDPNKVVDAMAYGAPGSGLIDIAVTAGKWDNANFYVSGATPYSFNGTADQYGFAYWHDLITAAPTLSPTLQPTTAPTPVPSTAAPSPAPTPLGVATIRRINCGGPTVQAQAQANFDYEWEEDTSFLSPSAPSSFAAMLSPYSPVTLGGAITQEELTVEVVRTQRQWQIAGGSSEIALYVVRLNHTGTSGAGRFEVRLFLVNMFDVLGSNVFDLYLQGQLVRTGIDGAREAQGNVTQVTVDNVDVHDGVLYVGVRSTTNSTIVVSMAAIEILPTAFSIPWPTPAPVPVVGGGSAAPTPAPTVTGLYVESLLVDFSLDTSVLNALRIPASVFSISHPLAGGRIDVTISGVSSQKPRESARVQLWNSTTLVADLTWTRDQMLANSQFTLSPDSYADIGDLVLPFVLQLAVTFDVTAGLSLPFSAVRVTRVYAATSATVVECQVAVLLNDAAVSLPVVLDQVRTSLFSPATGALFSRNITSYVVPASTVLSEGPVLLCDTGPFAVEASRTTTHACPNSGSGSSSTSDDLLYVYIFVPVGVCFLVLLLLVAVIVRRRRKGGAEQPAGQGVKKHSSQWEVSALEKHTHGSGELINESVAHRRVGSQEIALDEVDIADKRGYDEDNVLNGGTTVVVSAPPQSPITSEVNRAPQVTPRHGLHAPRNSLVLDNTHDGLLHSDTPSPQTPEPRASSPARRASPALRPSSSQMQNANGGTGGTILYNTTTPNKTTTASSVGDNSDTMSIGSMGSGVTVLTGVTASTAAGTHASSVGSAQRQPSLDSLAVKPLTGDGKDPNDDVFSWTTHVAPSGREYYYNRVTKETTWKKPLVLMSGWQESRTPSGRVFYYNSNTGESSWVRPGLEDIAESARTEDGNDSDGGSKPMTKARSRRLVSSKSSRRAKSSTALRSSASGVSSRKGMSTSVSMGALLPSNKRVVKYSGSKKKVVRLKKSGSRAPPTASGRRRTKKKGPSNSNSSSSLSTHRTDSWQ